MNAENPIAQSRSITERVKNILVKPRAEWPVIATEKASIAGLFTSYVMILAAIPALAQLVGSLVFGYSALGFTYRPSFGSAIGTAVSQYVLSLVMVLILGLVIDALAPKFGGEKNRLQAFKLAAYAGTAAWLAGAAALVPPVAFLAILGVYSIYLLYLGLPVLMKSATDKTLAYTVVVILVAAVLAFVIGLVTRPVTTMFGGESAASRVGSGTGAGGSVSVPGVGTIDLNQMERAAKQAEKASQDLKDGKITSLSADVLEKSLPEKIGRFQRVSVESNTMGVGGIAGSQVEGRYEAGDRYFELSITDLPAVGPMAAMGAAMGVQRERKTATGYERTHVVDGNFVNEEWDGTSNEGSYTVMVGNRISIKAQGKVSDMDELRAAIAAVRPERLASLVK